MLSILCLAACLCSSPRPEPLDGWTTLPIPALSEPALELSQANHLAGGSHISSDEYERSAVGYRPAPYLPLNQVIELLEADARHAGTDLRCLRIAPPLLVRGSTAGIERARLLVAELDRAGRAHRSTLQVDLRPAGAGDDRAVANGGFELRSGESLTVGERESVRFLSDFDVEVATGGGAAYPSFQLVDVGKTVSLTAWRTPDGESVFVSGTLDLSELQRVDRFDPGAPELGILEQPRVGSVVVRFSGLIAGDAPLLVEVSGAPLAEPDWRLSIRAATRRDEPDRWRVADLAWLESLAPVPTLPEPGVGLELPDNFASTRVEREPLQAAILWGELEASFTGRRADRPLFALAPGVIVAPADDLRVWSELDPLLEAAVRARSKTTPVVVRGDGIEVRFSSAEGLDCSVQAGLETTALVGYDVELAQDYWMADPVVGRMFDGFLMLGQLSGDELIGSYWSSKSEPLRELEREEVIHGRVDLPHRRLSVGTLRVASGEELRTPVGLSVGLGSL